MGRLVACHGVHRRLQPPSTSAALVQPVQILYESNWMPRASADNEFANGRGIRGLSQQCLPLNGGLIRRCIGHGPQWGAHVTHVNF